MWLFPCAIDECLYELLVGAPVESPTHPFAGHDALPLAQRIFTIQSDPFSIPYLCSNFNICIEHLAKRTCVARGG